MSMVTEDTAGTDDSQGVQEAPLDAGAPSSTGDLAEGLQRVLSWNRQDPGLKIQGLTRLLGGSSRITWTFTATGQNNTEQKMVLRMDPPGISRPGSLVLEGELMNAAKNSGAPVPTIYLSSDDPGLLGAPFVLMEFIDGESHPRSILRDKKLEKLRPQLAGMCGQALAKIHAIPPESVPGLATIDVLGQIRTQLEQLGEPHPVFELGLRYLESSRPAPLGLTVVHGDFRNGNLIVGEEGIRGVIDWELSHIGDPMEDLGWLCVRSWRFGGPGPVGGFGSYNQLIFSYEHASGRVLDRNLLRWWELLSTVRWGVMTMMQAQAFSQGTHRSLDTALIGRRVCEVEWDTLALLSSLRKA